MSNELRAWLSKELEKQRWSQRELARQSSISQALVSQILSGDIAPSADFCIKLAQALGQPPENLLRMAGLLPMIPDDDQDAKEAAEIIRNLPPDKRKAALEYLRYLLKSREGE